MAREIKKDEKKKKNNRAVHRAITTPYQKSNPLPYIVRRKRINER